MSKKNNVKKNSANFYSEEKASFSLPVVYNIDVLAGLSDSDLYSRVSYLHEEKEKVYKKGYDTYAWEVELAYTHREIDIRKNRIAFHEKFLRSNPPSDECVEENTIQFSHSKSQDNLLN